MSLNIFDNCNESVNLVSLKNNPCQVRVFKCTFRASCCSARLSRAQVPTFTGSSVQDRKKKGGTTYKGVRAVQLELVVGDLITLTKTPNIILYNLLMS